MIKTLNNKNHNDMESNKQYEKYIKLLEANKNLILTGAPGTGKTYLAKEIAKAMNAEYEFVQFHPSYDYTDFVEGLRPTPPAGNGNIGFERKNGVFKEFCKKAIEKVDEIKIVMSNPVIPANGTSFNAIYNSIVSDIRNGKIQYYQNRQGDNIPLKIKDNDRIGYEYGNTYRTIRERNVELMYNYFLSNNIFDLSKLKKDDYNDLIKQLTTTTETLDYVLYGWILQTLLDRTPQHGQSIVAEEKNIVDRKHKKYVFIIDEINRGEISKMFGELFFSIDPGYRGKNGLVKTQYQNLITDKTDPFYDGFYVPDNVYIIGTMNDIDRSVESMDFAMRRRFAWAEVKANENVAMLDDLGEMKEEVVRVMNRLNTAIWDEAAGTGIDGLNEAYHIGGSYFSKIRLYLNADGSNKKEAYGQLWDNHLKGVLFEYLRGMSDAMENLKKLEQVYYNDRANDNTEG